MDYQLLKGELDTPPYAGLDDAAVAAALNAATITYYKTVPTAEVHNFLVNAGIYGKLLNAYHNHAVPQIRVVAETAIDTVMGQIPELSLSANSAIVQGGAALVQGGVITQAELDYITALAKRTRSRAQELVGTDVTEQDVARARVQDKVEALEAVQRRAASGSNRVMGELMGLASQLANGQDVVLPDWNAVSALYNEETVDAGTA